MSGVYCHFSPADITFVATDAHKLVRYRRTDAAATGKMGADLMAQVAQATRLAVLGGVEQEKKEERPPGGQSKRETSGTHREGSRTVTAARCSHELLEV
jgi:hypothetical protein